ncbi:IS4 family transposase [Alkalinema sp. FACHB-956]|uniref:IS4 family transposase n=1 Tax=Alkalinema sp. FACHB-956 TaxID=2692768 RepID=UPI001682CF03|nr:IS4 family transposase [Alkalinema sp. FACHB-956]MBD2329367.1 IS4 family transposase [Alkalinema sp. FACHB-956]
MEQISEIRRTLQPYLNWHGARIGFLALFLVALFRVKTVNLQELSLGFMGSAQSASHYKRLQRFFRQFELDYYEVARLVVGLMEIPQPWVLSIDRTNWQYGDCVFNILMLGVVHQGVAFPLLWVMLDKAGNSNQGERIDLLDEFVSLFPTVEVAYITGDREFLGHLWVDYLHNTRHLPLRLRIRHSEKLYDGRRQLTAKVLFSHLQIGQHSRLRQRRRLWGHWLYVAALRLEAGDLLVVVSDAKPNESIRDYGQRWGIETLFGCFKTRGFCLESTHLQAPERLSRMIALLSIALCWGRCIIGI